MNIRSRSIAIALSSALVIAAVVVIAIRSSAPSGGKELKKLISGFMDSLPEEITVEQRDEIRGIMDRFYAKAVSEGVDPESASRIEIELRGYVENRRITKNELYVFMAEVGSVTRGTEPPPRPHAKADSARSPK
jgi:hypothetical protein